MTSPCLKLAIGLGVRFGVPFVEGAERIVRFFAVTGFGDNHALVVDFVNQFIAWVKVQGGAHRLRNGRLRLGRKLAGNHGDLDSENLRNEPMVRNFLARRKRQIASALAIMTFPWPVSYTHLRAHETDSY